MPDPNVACATVEVTVTNAGERHGAEVVQVYVGDPMASVDRPVRELKGFTKVRLVPGESRRMRIELDQRAFAYWGEAGWTVEPGTFRIKVGVYTRDIHAVREIHLEVPPPMLRLDGDSPIGAWLAHPVGGLLLAELLSKNGSQVTPLHNGEIRKMAQGDVAVHRTRPHRHSRCRRPGGGPRRARVRHGLTCHGCPWISRGAAACPRPGPCHGRATKLPGRTAPRRPKLPSCSPRRRWSWYEPPLPPQMLPSPSPHFSVPSYPGLAAVTTDCWRRRRGTPGGQPPWPSPRLDQLLVGAEEIGPDRRQREDLSKDQVASEVPPPPMLIASVQPND